MTKLVQILPLKLYCAIHIDLFVCADSVGALVTLSIKTGMMPSFLLPVKVNLLLVCLFSCHVSFSWRHI